MTRPAGLSRTATDATAPAAVSAATTSPPARRSETRRTPVVSEPPSDR
ncbi:hypothetical protein AB0O28_06205 [Microbispora sp. NPDC088329]